MYSCPRNVYKEVNKLDRQKNELRGYVAARFKSVNQFAIALGWSYSKTMRIVNGAQQANASDIKQMVGALGLTDPGEIVSLFILPSCPQNV